MNVVIQGALGNVEPWDYAALWGDEPHAVVDARTLPELLVALGIYPTRSAARRAGREGPVPPGFTLLRASKRVPELAIWNPSRPLTACDLTWGAILDHYYPC